VYPSEEGALMSQDVAQDTPFRETWFRTGYAPEEVESFVKSVEDALRSHAPGLEYTDVAWHEFRTVVRSPGYLMDDVDEYLQRAAHVLKEREGPRWEYETRITPPEIV
jgi:DivIVA domain-containing protein